MDYIGQVVIYNKLKLNKSDTDYFPLNEDIFPSRNIFINQSLKEQELQKIKKGQPINFLPHYVKERKLRNSQAISLIGITESGTKASVLIEEFKPFLYVFCNHDVFNCSDSIVQTYNGNLDRAFLAEVSKDPHMKSFIEKVNEYTNLSNSFVAKPVIKTIYNAGEQKYPKHFGFRLDFDTMQLLSITSTMLYKEEEFYVTSHTYNLDSYFAKLNKQLGSWVTLNNYKCKINNGKSRFNYMNGTTYELPTKTKAEFCFTCQINDYVENDKHEAVYPNLIASYDIETTKVYPKNYNKKDKPKKKKDPKDKKKKVGIILSKFNKVFNISIDLIKEGTTQKLPINIYYTYDGEYHPELATDKAYNICCNSERQVLLAFTLVLERFQPDYLLHYNGSTFDVPQILISARMNDMFDEMYCRTSCYYFDTYNPNSFIKHNGCKYQTTGSVKSSSTTMYYTYWSSIKTTPKVSGMARSTNLKKPQMLGRFKLEGETSVDYHYWSPPGSITIDMVFVCRKAKPKEVVHSLNHFLSLYRLDSKEDVSYSDIWKYWLNNDMEGLKKVFSYCVYDSEACYLLAQKQFYFSFIREFAKFTHMSCEKIIYRADTIKNINTIVADLAKENGVMIEKRFPHDNKTYKDLPHMKHHMLRPKENNEGAFVEIHHKGKVHIGFRLPSHLQNKDLDWLEHKFQFEFVKKDAIYALIPIPEEADDFASLYPSIMITFNVSSDTLTLNKNNLNPDEEYHSFDTTDMPEFYKEQSDKFYYRKHQGKSEKMGILPRILIEWFDRRKAEKGNMNKWYGIADKLKKTITKEVRKKYPDISDADQFAKLVEAACDKSQEYKEAIVNAMVYEKKQLVIKVLMNTMYGACSDHKGVLYEYSNAFIITKKGREAIKLSNKILTEFGARVNYNDTDSSYFIHNVSVFKDIIDRYFNCDFSKGDFDRKMVNRSIKHTLTKRGIIGWYTNKKKKLSKSLKKKEISQEDYNERIAKCDAYIEKYSNPDYQTFNDRLNQRFVEWSGYNRLIMQREETLYPAIHCLKKFYFGVKHEHYYKENFVFSDILYRGMPITKRNFSPMVKEIVRELIMSTTRSYKINVYEIVIEIIQDYIDKYIKDDVENKYKFVQMNQKYKQDKNNLVSKILENSYQLGLSTSDEKLKDLCREPDNLEIKHFVYTMNNLPFNLRMCKNSDGVTKYVYFSEIAEYCGMKIDYAKYIEGSSATIAQILSYKEDWGVDQKIIDDIKSQELVKDQVKIIKYKIIIPLINNMIAEKYKLTPTYKAQSIIKTAKKTSYNLIFIKYISNLNHPLVRNMMSYIWLYSPATNRVKIKLTDNIIKKTQFNYDDNQWSLMLGGFNKNKLEQIDKFLERYEIYIINIIKNLLISLNKGLILLTENKIPVSRVIDYQLNELEQIILECYFKALIQYPINHELNRRKIVIENEFEELE